MNDAVLGLDELCSQTGLTRRTVRFYIQVGLVDRPVGTTRGAHYTRAHLEQLTTIRKLREEGMSLEGIGRMMRPQPTADLAPAVHASASGAAETWRRIPLSDGVELHLRSGAPGSSPMLPDDFPGRSLREKYATLLRFLRDLNDKEHS